ncbi:sirohydrochlorin cobaltochelatase [Octadecabacter temperatus]|uniref:Sirohydrochlorin cobaltochelatase n=1 Tax=Octadecabacter temperatus TaxID=1458307 RepID=A0A0K0Y1E2_9RHOB|nr:sirohydrochlorin chelatase [Octadecabacter temperatus]AKS44759.1 Sirohydrochlorin cobaltochelatase [Octadecabacter temperatus]SIO35575.1 sirohydrochlorin cobaltochelatase [Octadecabacter temperatus]
MNTSPKTGVMICGHGSRSQSAVDEFATLADKLPAYLPDDWQTEYGYLEFANPVIRDGLDKLREAGCERILAVPGMLFAAMHSKNDIPTVLNTYAAKHGVEISYGRELGVDPKMIAAAAGRIQEAVDAANKVQHVDLHDTCLVVIGRGASDPDANGNVAKIARMLQEGIGFGWLEVGYSGVTFPLVEPCLTHAAKLGYKRIIVAPYFLFSGILIDRIYGFTDQVAAQNPDIQFVKAGYLGDHPKVLETFAERIIEQTNAAPPPNCGVCGYREQVLAFDNGEHRHIKPEQRNHPAFSDTPPPTCVLCKYRTQVLGFETEVGAIQESHHHHVEGQGASAPGSNVADCKQCDTFCTGMCRLTATHDHHHHHDHDHDHHHHGHDHDHHHAVYPHADHPHGPESARKAKA